MTDEQTSAKTVVLTDDAPPPAHAFSQGLRIGGLVQVSGQGAVDPGTGEYVGAGDVGRQTEQTLRNVSAVLQAASCSTADVLMLRVYLTTRDDFAAMNAAYESYLRDHLPDAAMPCRTTVFVQLPHETMLVEIDALAVVPSGAKS